MLRQDSFSTISGTTIAEKSLLTSSSVATINIENNDLFYLDGKHIKDSSDRTILLRGINLSGASKNPSYPLKIPSHQPEEFFDHKKARFIGRPFPLESADEHFQRLKLWGFNFLRFIVTWEAIEHEGPGKYDYEFIDYIIKILHKAKAYGFKCFIDPHQDVWSRFSGGSGAPGWTLELAGFNIRNFSVTEAAIVQNTYDKPIEFPKMIWSTNYYKLASATMFTLFYSGRIFAPKCIVDDMNIEDYLQLHFINSYKILAERIVKENLSDNVVVGYDTMNEPSWGWAGTKDLNKLPEFQEYKRGKTPTPFQAMLLGEGIPCKVDEWDIVWYGFGKVGSKYIDPKGKTAWLENDPEGYNWMKSEEFPRGGCIWAAHGVWDKSTGKLLRPDYFTMNPITKKSLNWYEDSFKPFIRKYTSAIRSVHPNAIIFVQPPVLEVPPKFDEPEDPQERLMYSPHWYDGLTLVQKQFNWWNIDYLGLKRGKYLGPIPAIKVGDKAIKQSFAEQLGLIKDEGEKYLDNIPCIIGEIGIPFDMEKGKAYKTGNYIQQIRALDANFVALESNLLSYTLWNYCDDNDNKWGDQWNGEDLSIYSTSNPTNSLLSYNYKKDLDIGGRALFSLLRPFPLKTFGEPLSLNFNPWTKKFYYSYRNLTDTPKDFPTEIYLPKLHFNNENDFTVKVNSGKWIWDKDNQRILYWHDTSLNENKEKFDYSVHEIYIEGKRNLLNVDLVREVTSLPYTINEKRMANEGYSIKAFGGICLLMVISFSIVLNYYDMIFS
ncbi:hypothetical protein RclHR1_01330015 [Rhizophagus clarus]|uniref:Glycoside hydrolase family 5 protein n=1 Tax=Rhizophagus clarus TaxID=94130 RepID=A0A2Z6QQ36_9GLOM|nr:hypothetical protein RclHR1_01330015 [Rhizophagus clarus]GES79884.1 glycoside hydrolase family 5 protein [Rhizophagus clarus]